MIAGSVSPISVLEQSSFSTHDELADVLAKAEALAQVALGDDFLEYEKCVTDNYLGLLIDLLRRAQYLHQQLA